MKVIKVMFFSLVFMSFATIAFATASVIEQAYVNGIGSVTRQALNSAVPDSAIRESVIEGIQDGYEISKKDEADLKGTCPASRLEERAGLTIAGVVDKTNQPRTMIVDVYREYLKNPENLKSFYFAKKHIILQETKKTFPKAISWMKIYLRELYKTLEAVSDDEIRNKVTEYINLNNKLDKIGDASKVLYSEISENSEIKAIDSSLWWVSIYCDGKGAKPNITNSALLSKIATYCDLRAKGSQGYDEREKKLEELEQKIGTKFVKAKCHETQNYLHVGILTFAQRRYLEGGMPLVNAYKDIAFDLAASINSDGTKSQPEN